MPTPELQAVTQVTPALQQVLRLLPRQPYVAALVLPRETAPRALARIVERYPTISAHRNTRSALRSLGLPSVTALLMPPDADSVTLLLFANTPPADDREEWRLAAEPAQPLTWRGYELATVRALQEEANRHRRPQALKAADAERMTWRLSAAKRAEYRQQITRVIHSTKPAQGAQRSGGPREGTTRTTAGQHVVLLRLGAHLRRYPGLHGIRQDVWLLKVHMRRHWRNQHPRALVPDWGRMPYCNREPVEYAPLSALWSARVA